MPAQFNNTCRNVISVIMFYYIFFSIALYASPYLLQHSISLCIGHILLRLHIFIFLHFWVNLLLNSTSHQISKTISFSKTVTQSEYHFFYNVPFHGMISLISPSIHLADLWPIIMLITLNIYHKILPFDTINVKYDTNGVLKETRS